MKYVTFFTLFSLLIVVSFSFTQAGIWVQKADMPTARTELCVAAVNGKIYVIGGATAHSGSTLGMVEVYDPMTDTWDNNKTPMPTPRKGAACGVINNKIYIAGGTVGSNWAISNKLEIYDPDTDTWDNTKMNMLAARYYPQGVVVNDTFYVSGGLIGSPWTGQLAVQKYDPTTDNWEFGTNLNQGRVGHTTNVIDGKIYAIGGDTQPPVVKNIEEYDPQAETWEVIDTTPSVMISHTSSVYGNEIYIFSGTTKTIDQLTLTDDVYYYHNKPGVAYAKSIQSWPTFIPTDGETLIINAQLYNPENHPVSVQAIISGEQNAYTDSIQLYDDGLHSDSLALDNIYGNSKWLSDLEEDIYTIEVSSHDLTEDFQYILPSTTSYTTIGPIEIDSVSAARQSASDPTRIVFDIYLGNHGKTTTSKNIEAIIFPDTSHDCFVSTGSLYREYGDIAPGESKVGLNFNLYLDESCLNTIVTIPFTIDISSDGSVFWSDHYELIVNDIEIISSTYPKAFKLGQNYPNPFNPKTIINYELPITNDVELSIYNLLGQKVKTMVSEKQRAGYHQVEWDASHFSSGIYYYRIEAGEFQDVKKMILLR